MSCRYSDKIGKQTYHTFLNTQPISITKRTYLIIIRSKRSSQSYSTICNSFSHKSEEILFSVFRLCSVGWLDGCFGFNGPLRQYFSLYRAASQREGERGEKIAESKNVQTTPTRTYCKRNRPFPYYHPNCRTPRPWKFTQNHRTTRPPPLCSDFCGKLLIIVEKNLDEWLSGIMTRYMHFIA